MSTRDLSKSSLETNLRHMITIKFIYTGDKSSITKFERKDGGKIDLSLVKDRYWREFGETIPTQGVSLKDWVQPFDSISIIKSAENNYQWFAIDIGENLKASCFLSC